MLSAPEPSVVAMVVVPPVGTCATVFDHDQ